MKKKGFIYLTLFALFVMVTGIIKANTLVKHPHKKNKLLFDCPTLDTSLVIIKSSDCGASNGSITGLQGNGTGNLTFTWYDVNSNIIGNGADLTGIPPGQYRVTLKDESKCLPVSQIFYLFENNPIQIVYNSGTITPPGCNQTNGSITNINVTGADKYQWTNDLNKVVANSKDLINADIGTYVFTASTNGGCIRQARYTINPGGYAPVIASYQITKADCGNQGGIHIGFNIGPNDPSYIYSITDSAGVEYKTGSLTYTPNDSTTITIPTPLTPGPPPYPLPPGLSAGTYTLRVIGGLCITNLLTFVVPQDTFRIDASQVIIKGDVCGQNIGAITNLEVIGGPRPSVKYDPDPTHGYFWRDSTGKRVASTLYLAGVPGGKYTFTVVNSEGCVTPTLTFIIPDSVSRTSKPLVDNINMCLSGIAVIKVKNLNQNATYHLYDANLNLITTNTSGYFMPYVKTSTAFYVGAVDGICESPLAKVIVNVATPGIVIPNTFTPNQDGSNDKWDITGIDRFPGTEISIFNRNGFIVYHSINYSQPFDGRYNGADLPVGTYYYIVDTHNPACKGAISGSVTIIR